VVATTVGFALHRGVVAVADRPAPLDVDTVLAGAVGRRGASPVVAVLEGLNDHENIGALFRNAAAFGVGGVLLDPTCADPLYRRSVRVSMGHVLHVPFARLDPWPSGLRRVRDHGFVVAALAPHPTGADGPPGASLRELADRAVVAGAGVALLLGAEGPGLSEPALAAADAVVAIPMADGVDSLNVSTAAAIAFHALAPG
jgi:tRNA G18 (ribose-2'-O)-methylase SpoU